MRIAVIGGIGSGKSEVLKVAREMGAKCLSADEINSELLKTPDYVEKIRAQFPFVVNNGVVDRAALSAEIFSDSAKREKLDSIAHPQILKRIAEETASPLVVELPLLLESGTDMPFDEIILVSAPFIKRLKMLKLRGVGAVRAIRIIRTQARLGALKRIATHTLKNNGSIAKLRAFAKSLFAEILY